MPVQELQPPEGVVQVQGRWVYDERHLCHSPQERLFWNGAGAVPLGILGEIRGSWLPALLLGSLLGGYLGAHWSIIKGNLWIKRVFEAITLLVGLKLIF